jgi:hypothetical protein
VESGDRVFADRKNNDHFLKWPLFISAGSPYEI